MSASADVADLGGLDVLVYRRVRAGRYAHLGGRGRGEGWAGIVEVDLDDEPVLRDALADDGVARLHSDDAQRVAGPYWASDAAIVPLSHDEFVVVGGRGGLIDDEDRVREVARHVSSSIGAVTPAKRLADELELLHAVSDVAMTPIGELEDVATAVAGTALAALSCEVGVLHLPAHGVTAVVTDGAPHRPDVGEAAAWADLLVDRLGDGELVVQEVVDEHLLPDGWWARDIVSLIAVRVDADGTGVLALAHTTAGPRGFTQLCRQIAGSVANAARPVLIASTVQHLLREEAASAAATARTDELTGVRNRRGWEEALAVAADRHDGPVSVLMADVNFLKQVNDEQGHDAGDEVLRTAARAICGEVRSDDVVGRIGGDEFCALLPGVDPQRAEEVVQRVRRAAADATPSVSLAVGAATAVQVEDPDDLERAVCRADDAMYADKGHRRRERTRARADDAAAADDGAA